MKKCLYCGEKIQNEAKKCRHCGEWLDKDKDDKKVIKKGLTSSPKKKEVPPLKKAEYNIKVALVCSIITIILSIIMFFVNFDKTDNIYTAIDIIFFIIFAFGIYKKSRVAAISAFAYFILGKISQITTGEFTAGLSIWGVLFAIGYFKGIQGSLLYHKIIKTTRIAIREIILGVLAAIMIILAIIGMTSSV